VTQGVGQTCALELERAILRGSYPAGSRLPPERRLAERMGVSRLTLRHALAELRASGLLSVRQGSGYQVRDFWRRCGIEIVGSLLDLRAGTERALAMIDDLLAVRRALAKLLLERLSVTTVSASARRRVEEAIVRLEEAVVAEGPEGELAARDLDILAALAAATDSEVLRLCLNPVGRVLSTSLQLQRAMYRRPSDNVVAYRALLAWLDAGARADAIEPMMAMLTRIDAATTAAFAEESAA